MAICFSKEENHLSVGCELLYYRRKVKIFSEREIYHYIRIKLSAINKWEDTEGEKDGVALDNTQSGDQ